ncbi:MAG: EamA family transporter [Hyphomonadaceae bacterium]|nr:EamA family transporter [Hyphomonadaceae bacterium]
MPPEAIAAALLSALIHAGWNAALKAGRDRLVDLGQMAIGGVALGAALTAIYGAPPPQSWPYIAASCAVHFVYWTALSRGYAAGDMSHVYTIARGSAPALVTLGAAFAASEAPAFGQAFGVASITIGVFLVGFSPTAPLRATAWAALTGAAIAAYSLIDALGARVAGDVFAYKGWGAVGTFLPILAFAVARRGPRRFAEAGRGRWAVGAVAGALSIAGFALVLWAQMRAPIGPITALRETSVVFGAAIAALALKETVAPRRWLGAGIVATGALMIGLM